VAILSGTAIAASDRSPGETIGKLRSDVDGVIVPAMAGHRKHEIRDQDVQGLKVLRQIRPLLSQLRKVGIERDRAGNR
jgi:hypothetical protein